MALPAPFTWKPLRDSKPVFTPSVNSIQLGNNLEQIEALGPNNIAEEWQLVFQTKNQTDMQAICAYLAALQGAAPFPWTPPPPFDSAQGLWVCKGPWNPEYLGGLIMQLSTTFTRYFGPTP